MASCQVEAGDKTWRSTSPSKSAVGARCNPAGSRPCCREGLWGSPSEAGADLLGVRDLASRRVVGEQLERRNVAVDGEIRAESRHYFDDVDCGKSLVALAVAER